MEEECEKPDMADENRISNVKKNLAIVIIFGLVLCERSTDRIYSFDDGDEQLQSDLHWHNDTSVLITVLGSLFVGIFLEIFGRTRAIQLNLSVLITGIVFELIYSVLGITFLYFVGHFIKKFAAGMQVCAIVYLAETSNPTSRGVILSSLFFIAKLAKIDTRVLFLHDYKFIDDRTELLVVLIVLSSLFYFSKYLPESRVWWRQNGRTSAVVELVKIPLPDKVVASGGDVTAAKDVNENGELEEVIVEENAVATTAAAAAAATASSSDKPRSGIVSSRRRLKLFDFVQNFVTLATLFAVAAVISVGSRQFLLHFESELLVEQVAPVRQITLIVIYAFTALGVLLIDRIDRRVLFEICWLGVASSLFSVAVYEYLFDDVPIEYKPTRFCFSPFIGLWLTVGLLTVGGQLIPFVMSGEIFAAAMRGFVSGLLWVAVDVNDYVVVQYVYPAGRQSFSENYEFLAAFAACAVGACVLGLMLPETRGKTLDAIEIKSPRRRRDNKKMSSALTTGLKVVRQKRKGSLRKFFAVKFRISNNNYQNGKKENGTKEENTKMETTPN